MVPVYLRHIIRQLRLKNQLPLRNCRVQPPRKEQAGRLALRIWHTKFQPMRLVEPDTQAKRTLTLPWLVVLYVFTEEVQDEAGNTSARNN